MDRAILSNQNDIIHILLENDENREILVFPLKNNSGTIQITINDNKDEEKKMMALKDLKNYSNENDNLRLYKYCCALIDLGSEMSLDRNHRAMNYLHDIYSLEIVFKAITHQDLDFRIKSNFVRMMKNLYLDKDPFDKLKVPNFTRIWNEISIVGNRIPYFKGDIPQYISNLKSFVIDYLKGTKGVQSIFDSERNQMTLQVIQLAKQMVAFGFYKNKDELRDISIALIALLNG